MNKLKTKVMMENDTPKYVNNTQIKNVESYIYLGQRYSATEKDQDKEIQGETWALTNETVERDELDDYWKGSIYHTKPVINENVCTLTGRMYLVQA